MKRLYIYCFFILFIWLLLANFFILKNRWGNKKAIQVFNAKHVPLKIYDTLVNETNIHFAIAGNDTLPTLVFIHGSPGSWMHYYKYMIDPDLLKKYRVVAIDRPGFGHSNFGTAKHLSDQANLIFPVLKKLKTNKPMFLAGHSMGAPVTVALAAKDSTLFHSIILMAGSIDVLQEKEETWRIIMNKKPLNYLLPGAFAPSNVELLYLKKDLITLQKEFVNVKCNIVFVHGDKDTWVPIENVAYGVKMMKNAKSIQVDTLQNADHQIPWKNYNEIKNILLQLN